MVLRNTAWAPISSNPVSGSREKALEALPHRTTKTSYLTYESFLSSTIFPMH